MTASYVRVVSNGVHSQKFNNFHNQRLKNILKQQKVDGYVKEHIQLCPRCFVAKCSITKLQNIRNVGHICHYPWNISVAHVHTKSSSLTNCFFREKWTEREIESGDTFQLKIPTPNQKGELTIFYKFSWIKRNFQDNAKNRKFKFCWS